MYWLLIDRSWSRLHIFSRASQAEERKAALFDLVNQPEYVIAHRPRDVSDLCLSRGRPRTFQETAKIFPYRITSCPSTSLLAPVSSCPLALADFIETDRA